MTKRIKVTQDKRFVKRKSYNALGSLVKILTEIVTNSDDSYRRLKKDSANDHECEINVYINKQKKKITIVDYAEGMDSVDIENNFQRYGADKSGREAGHKIRGIFGQGASDVLFTQNESKVYSFKNNSAVKAIFCWDDDDRYVDVDDLTENEANNIRKEYKISGNGTVVSFVLDEKIRIPLKIFEEMCQFYMLRFIMSDKTRKIILNYNGSKKNQLPERTFYEFPVETQEETIFDNLIKFKFEDKIIEGELKLLQIKDKAKKEKKHGELKILVFDDENNVYDNTFFKLGDKYPGVEKLHGYLKLYKTADIIREKLNQDKPEEILQDTRDGLNTRHEFYLKLNGAVLPIIERSANKLNSLKTNTVNSSDFKNQKKMFEELNKLLKEELEEIDDLYSTGVGVEPPSDGFDFARERIRITLGKKYSLKVIVNNDLLNKGDKIFLKNGNKEISVDPDFIKVAQPDNDKNISYYNIYIKGNKLTGEDSFIEAVSPELNITKKLFISVIPENIHYPKAPIEFYPSFLYAKTGNKSKLNLYINTAKVDINSEIKVISTNKKIKLSKDSFIITEKNIIDESVALVKIEVFCDKNRESGKVIASCKGYLAEAEVQFNDKDSEPPSKNKSDFLNGWELANNSEALWQKYLHPKTGKVIINVEHFINKEYFGDNPTAEIIKKSKICQKYLSEILSDELAQYMVNQLVAGGKVNSDHGSIMQAHQMQKNKFANVIYKFKLE